MISNDTIYILYNLLFKSLYGIFLMTSLTYLVYSTETRIKNNKTLTMK